MVCALLVAVVDVHLVRVGARRRDLDDNVPGLVERHLPLALHHA